MDGTSTTSDDGARQARKRREREARVSLILRTAREVFDERGYQRSSVAEIAERAGFAKSSVYSYFQSKEEIFLTLLVEDLNDLRISVASSVEGATTPAGKVAVVLDRLMAFLRKRNSYYDVLVFLNPGDSPETVPKPLEDAWSGAIMDNLELVGEVFSSLKDDASGAPDRMQRTLILVGLGLGIYALLQSRSRALRDVLDYDQLMRIVRDEVIPSVAGIQ